MQQYTNPTQNEWEAICQRPTASLEAMMPTIKSVFDRVAEEGDRALRAYTKEFDGVICDSLCITQDQILAAVAQIPNPLKEAIQQAHQNIETFHKAQQTEPVHVETQAGVKCWQQKYPIEKVGLYIPGGTAPLFSTVLMLAIPAKIAGCREIVLCSPPQKNGQIAPEVVYTAQLCGVTQLFAVGGAQAIAAMALGTESIPQVDKLFGPGNQYVTAAKQYASQGKAAIDMPAGPSEVLIAIDATANLEFVAADLLSQAEHGVDSQVVLVTTAPDKIPILEEILKHQLNALARKEMAAKALGNSKLISFNDSETAIAFINDYAPEHYIINVSDTQTYVNGVRHAGSVFIGPYTPESVGDYASGTNHTLPTNGYARQYSGVNLDSFLKAITFQEISVEGIQALGPAVEKMAAAEGLDAHKNAVSLRLKSLL